MKTNKKVAIIAVLDGYANSVRPQNINIFLTKNGYDVEIIDVIKISNILKHLTFKSKVLIFPLLVISITLTTINLLFLRSIKYIFYNVLTAQMIMRGYILYFLLTRQKYHAVIVETSYYSYVLKMNLGNTIKIYDCPAPWAYELFGLGYFTAEQFEKFKNFEVDIYQKSDFLCFQWYLYRSFVEKHAYKGHNLFDLNYGCEPKINTKLAVFDATPKIVYLGYLAGEWNNMPLLSKLSKMYPFIDVYGGPVPDKNLKLNYKGYAPTTEVLKNYQFGLITFTKDEYRKFGFASKHLEYISFGLPVLLPEWRNDPLLESTYISYNEDNFLKKIKEYSNEYQWLKKQKNALDVSKELTWNKTLAPLLTILNNN